METSSCNPNSVSYCGIRNKKYPDKRAMGYPFDRNIADTEGYLQHFMTKSQSSKDNFPEHILNMKAIDVEVKFEDKTVEGPTMKKYFG